MAPPSRPPPPPADVIGPYRVVRALGAGATSRVFEGERHELGKRVAIKLLFPRGEAGVARFLREGRAAARVRHPHVVDVFDVGTCDRGLYLVMELVEGGTLASRVPAPGRADVETALAWLLPVVSAVCAAHAARVVHRDLKPSNVLAAFDARGGLHPKVSDFGISKLDDDDRELTNEGGLLGTPAYMAPEQMIDPRSAGPAADQYSLGVLLHLFVTGLLPYEAPTTFALMSRVVAGDLTPLHERSPGLPRALGDAIGRALSAPPAQRFPSVHALGAALLPFASARTRAIWAPEFGPDTFDVPERPPPAAPHAGGGGASDTLRDGGVGASDTLDDRAPELPAREADTKKGWYARPAVRAGRVARWSALGLAGAVGVALVWRSAGPGRAPGVVGGFSANASPARTKIEGAAQAYRLGLGAMQNSAWEAGIEHFEQATQLDPEFGAAHLRLAMAIGGPEPPALRALRRARVLRAGLSDRDLVFLEALEAFYFETPANREAYVARLRAGAAKFPRDAELTMHLAIALQAEPTWAEAERLAERAISLEPGYPDALQTKARARAARGDVDGALDELARCVESAPLAVGCLRAQASLRARAGRCDAMASGLRRWSAIDPRAFEPQQMHAGLLAWEGKPWQAVEEVLRRRWPRSSAEERPLRERKDRVRLALYRNQYEEAISILDGLGPATGFSPDEETDDWATEHLMFALDAAGRPADAARVAREYLARVAARPATRDAASDVRLRAAALAHHAGLLERDAAQASTDAALGLGLGDAAGTAALGADAALVELALARGADEAAAALRAIEAGGVTVPRELAAARAKALSLAGRAADARRALEAGMGGCDGLALPFLVCRLALEREGAR